MKRKDSGRSPKNFPRKKNTAQKSSPPEYSQKLVRKAPGELIRLNKFISNSGVCSRREADSLIESGDIKVNTEVIREMGYKVKPTDKVFYKNKQIKREKMVYVLLNKPKGYITTMSDPENRKTVMDLVKNSCDERIYPVGRLDRNTSGLLLFTNDGLLAEKLTHPSYEMQKIYQIEIDKPITQQDYDKILNGIQLEDGMITVDDLAVVTLDKKTLGLEIHSGRNRIVRRIFESMGYEVERLDRVMYASLTKKDLPRGKWRYLSEKELGWLKMLK